MTEPGGSRSTAAGRAAQRERRAWQPMDLQQILSVAAQTFHHEGRISNARVNIMVDPASGKEIIVASYYLRREPEWVFRLLVTPGVELGVRAEFLDIEKMRQQRAAGVPEGQESGDAIVASIRTKESMKYSDVYKLVDDVTRSPHKYTRHS